jgi:ATP phosphoribosyltransferase
MENKNILKIGMPAGSLANPKRGGNLIKLLENSGFKTSGYESGGPSKFTTINYMFGWDGRPQEFSSQLGISEIDVAIAGTDWIYERMHELDLEYNTKIQLEEVLPLNRGGVKIVGIIPDGSGFETAEDYLKEVVKKKSIITVASEMPYLSLNWVREKLDAIGVLEEFPDYSVQKYKTPSKIKHGVLIYETWGKTEAKVKNQGTDIGVEITQSGSAIRNYGLKIIDTIMTSQTGVWIDPKVKNNPEKFELLKLFLVNLYGSINAENRVMIVFNVPKSNVDEINRYLSEQHLFADEPTISHGKAYDVYNIQVDTANNELPLAKVRYDLAVRNAQNINTLPIESSISCLDAIGL